MKIKMSPLTFELNGVPRALHFHAWLLRRGLYYSLASHILKASLDLSGAYQCTPAEITPHKVDAHLSTRKVDPETRWAYFSAVEKYREFIDDKPNGVPLDWETTTGAIAELLGWKTRKVKVTLKHYAHSKGKELDDFRTSYGIFLAPLEFYTYAKAEKQKDEERTLVYSGD